MDGGFLLRGPHVIGGWCSQQGKRARSGAEAEFMGVVNGSARGIWLNNVLGEMGVEVVLQVNSGSSWGERHCIGAGLRASATPGDHILVDPRKGSRPRRRDGQDQRGGQLSGRADQAAREPEVREAARRATASDAGLRAPQVFGVILAAAVVAHVGGAEAVPAGERSLAFVPATATDQIASMMATAKIGAPLAIVIIGSAIRASGLHGRVS